MFGKLDILEKDIEVLTEFLKRDYGIDFSNYAKSSFSRRIDRILKLYNIPDCKMLIMKIKGSESFLTEFVEEVTVNTTELFRDPAFWIYLRDTLINKFSDYTTIRVWHAGCSSGEEVISFAIMMRELGLEGKLKSVASDLNQTIIDKAKKARYSFTALEMFEKNYLAYNPTGKLSNYYKIDGKHIQFDKTLLNNVEFRKHDLVNGSAFTKVNIILCRNVLIYFDQDLQDKVLKLFHESLLMDGYLGIGSKETLMLTENEQKRFAIYEEKQRVYRKLP